MRRPPTATRCRIRRTPRSDSAPRPPSSTTSCRRSAGRHPPIGEHTREILAELGYRADEITRFLADGVVTTGSDVTS